ncbi:hypothetical protein JS756_20215 [Streptomyces actuosus]|uniref:Uncharacterized protein n=1 Tax=Streptomyces actuosus TaxID=1885 RepID=A0ABS2VTL6_STRAS|nr:hypothetical protein [Streptomyces actuosus]MBN0046385.1 hypothetical protein [Streptomyces actuosus]
MTNGSAQARAERRDEERERQASRTVLGAVVLAFPVLKVAWTLGSSSAAGEVFLTAGVRSWSDALSGMVLTDALLASVLAIVVCRLVPFRLPRAPAAGGPATGRLLVLALTAPLAFGVIVGALHGWGWGVGTALVAYVLRVGRGLAERHRGTGPRTATGTVSLVLSLAVAAALPLVALSSCLSGRSWSPVLVCDVDVGTGPERERVIELSRTGPGVVGWGLSGHEAVNGVRCALAEDQQVRAPLWEN